jgi:hypothetical protein
MPRNGDAKLTIAPTDLLQRKMTENDKMYKQNATRQIISRPYILIQKAVGRVAHAGTALKFRILIG